MDDGQGGDARESGSDLFDRWLANRDPQPPEAVPAEADAADQPPEPAAEPAPEPSPEPSPQPSPEAAVEGAAEPAVEPAEEPVDTPDAPPVLDPLFDEAFPTDESEPTLQEPDIEIPDLGRAAPSPEAPPAPEVDIGRSIVAALAARPDGGAGSAPPEPPGLGDFEPVLTASARNRAPEPRRGRRSKRRREPGTEADTTADTADPVATEVDQPVDVALTTERTAPGPAPEQAAPAEPLTAPAPPSKPAPTPDHVDAGREVFAAFAAAPTASTEVPTAPDPKPGTKPEKKERREKRAKREKKALGAPPDHDVAAAGRRGSEVAPSVVQALLGSIEPVAPATEPREVPRPEPTPEPTPPAQVAAAGRPEPDPGPDSGPASGPDRSGYAVAAAGVSTNADFAPRTGPRRLVGLLLLVSLVGTAIAGYRAYADATTFNLGLAGTLGMLTLVIWAVRAGSAPVRMSVRSGQLEVVGSEGRFVFDLASRYTPIEVVGQPGRRGWKVLFLRRSMAPFVVDASMVDPEEFMRVLRQHRPDLP